MAKLIDNDSNKARLNEVKYSHLVVSLIRERYSLDEELSLLRQRDTKPDEFSEYNLFVEQCKAKAKDGIR